jgi:hypothetical protein
LATEDTQQRELNPSPCTAGIRELCVQFQCAITALASDDVEALEASTAVQDNLVEQLQLCFRSQPAGQQPAIKVSASDLSELINLTRVYSSLLQRALRTARLRAALCQTYKQNFPSASEPLAVTGWSCEV